MKALMFFGTPYYVKVWTDCYQNFMHRIIFGKLNDTTAINNIA